MISGQIPEGNWFCPDCRPKEPRRSDRRRRAPINDDDEEEEQEEDDDDSETEEDSDEESEGEEESEGNFVISFFLHSSILIDIYKRIMQIRFNFVSNIQVLVISALF